MQGRGEAVWPYRKRSIKAPIPTVKTMKYVFERHLKPFGGLELCILRSLSMFDIVAVVFGDVWRYGGLMSPAVADTTWTRTHKPCVKAVCNVAIRCTRATAQ